MAAATLLEQFLRDRPALARRQAEADRVIAASGAGHLVNELATGGPWRLDPVPLLVDGRSFDDLAAAVSQRVVGLEAVLADVYGPRRVVRDGVVPAEALAGSDRYRVASVGVPAPPRWVSTYAADVVALTDGSWRLVRDLTDTPTGVGYALLDRSVTGRVAAELLGPRAADDLASISGFPAELRHALAGTTEVRSPRIVLFTSGVDDPAYVEHSALARLLGFHLVEGPDLVVRRGRLWLRTLGGLEPIDVVYRRVRDDAVDPIEISATSGRGVPGILVAAAEGGVVLANAHGAGVVEDGDLAGYWSAAIETLTGAEPSLRRAGDGDELAVVPTFRNGEVVDAPVVVRVHAVAGTDGVTVMAGGNGRVMATGDDPVHPTARLAKDVWVLGADRTTPVVVAPALPQVDLVASVPTRAADAMFWLGRAAERAEAIARTTRVVAARRQQDPALISFDGGRWARRMAFVLRVVSGARLDADEPEGRPILALDRALAEATTVVAERIGALVAEAASVGEYLSGATTRVLRGLADVGGTFADGRAPIDALDDTIADLAALAGLWAESTVHGPAWRFGEIGRRVERALVVLGLVDACLRAPDRRPERAGAPVPASHAADIVEASAMEVLLAANESLVAYRRRHRSDIELDAAVGLLLRDADNPRSYAASVAHLAEHVRVVGWDEGTAAVDALRTLLDGDDPLADLVTAHEAVCAVAQLTIDTWFATPVNPILVHATPG